MRIIFFDNIIDFDELRLLWKGNQYFKPREIDDSTSKLIKNICAFRIEIGGAKGNRTQYENIFHQTYSILSKLIYSQSIFTYQFKIESKPLVRSKIRSYKGIFSKSLLDKASFIEAEISVGDHQTLIGGIVIMAEKNFDKLIPFIGDNRKCFLLQSSSCDILTVEFLNGFLKLGLSDDFNISYLQLFDFLYNQLGFVYRVSGDGGDTSLNIDVFCKKKDIQVVESSLGSAINH